MLNPIDLNTTTTSRFNSSVRDSSPANTVLTKAKPAFCAKQFAIPGLTDTDIEQLKEVFDHYDKDANNLLAPNEIRTWLVAQGFKATKETVYDIIAEYDEDEKGGLQFHEFLRLMTRGPPGNNENKEEISRVFRKFDKNKKGYITLDDLRNCAKDLGEELDEETLVEIISKVDSNMDGKVSFEDFYNVIVRKITF